MVAHNKYTEKNNDKNLRNGWFCLQSALEPPDAPEPAGLAMSCVIFVSFFDMR